MQHAIDTFAASPLAGYTIGLAVAVFAAHILAGFLFPSRNL